MEHDGTTLLDLPEGVLREVVSWSADGKDANALLSTCRTAHQHCRDPATAALLLLRCPCDDFDYALASCAASCHGGAAAVVHQLLQLLGASPESGGPMAAPARLLQAALYAASTAGDAHAIRALMALPQPPNINARGGCAAHAALRHRPVPHLGALQALLECGADPCAAPISVHSDTLVTAAAATPHVADALLLLLRHCTPAQLPAAATAAGMHALSAHSTLCLVRLLNEGPVNHVRWDQLVSHAAGLGALEALTLLLDRSALSSSQLLSNLSMATVCLRPACAALLLDRGAADGGALSMLLSVALMARPEGLLSWDVCEHAGEPAALALRGDERKAIMFLLLRHGAAVTQGVRHAAEGGGHEALLAAVEAEVAAAAAAEAAAAAAATNA